LIKEQDQGKLKPAVNAERCRYLLVVLFNRRMHLSHSV